MTVTSRRVYLVILAVTIVAHVAVALPCGAQTLTAAYIQLDAASHEEFNAAIRFIEDRGAVIRHRIYPYAAMGEIPEGSEMLLGAAPAMVDVFVGEVPSEKMPSLSKQEKWLAKAYNNVYFPAGKDVPGSHVVYDEVPIDLAPRTVPQESLERVKASAAMRGAPPPMYPATSEFLLGHVAVGVILTESAPGFGSQDWINFEEAIATEEVISAMDWWARHSPNQELRFSYEIHYRVPVYTEPLDRGGDQIEGIWADDSFTHLGYTQGDYFEKAFSYIFDMRDRYNADWGFSVFILHGNPGQQFDGFLAYAYLGGPFNVNTYSNGYLGPDDLDRVIAHESGHTFYTLDEYPNTYATCTSTSGYLNAKNANQQQGGSGCLLDVPCVMRGGSQPTPFEVLEPCYYTKGQVGWWDSDEDGIPDILDTNPIVTLVEPDTEDPGMVVQGDTVYTTTPSFRGTIEAVPIENKNPRSMSINYDFTVEPVRAEYRVDGGPWLPCEAYDGAFDGPFEGYSFTVDELVPWTYHTVEVRAVTEHGNTTLEYMVPLSQWFVDMEPVDPHLSVVSSNPTSGPVRISFSPSHSSGGIGVPLQVEVAVYDVTGRKIVTLDSGEYLSGAEYSVNWDGKGADRESVPAGVYFVGISYQGRMRSDKVILVP